MKQKMLSEFKKTKNVDPSERGAILILFCLILSASLAGISTYVYFSGTTSQLSTMRRRVKKDLESYKTVAQSVLSDRSRCFKNLEANPGLLDYTTNSNFKALENYSTFKPYYTNIATVTGLIKTNTSGSAIEWNSMSLKSINFKCLKNVENVAGGKKAALFEVEIVGRATNTDHSFQSVFVRDTMLMYAITDENYKLRSCSFTQYMSGDLTAEDYSCTLQETGGSLNPNTPNYFRYQPATQKCIAMATLPNC